MSSPHSIFERNGMIWGQTQSGKTWRASELIAECPHHCFFINTQYERRPEEFAQIVVRDNYHALKALEAGNKHICINYGMEWQHAETDLQKVDSLIQVCFGIAQKNPHHFRATIIIDELDKYITKTQVSPSINNLFNRGLRFNINAVGIGHLPQQVHNNVIDACSWFLFYRATKVAVLYWKKRGIDLDALEWDYYEGYYWQGDKLWLFSHNRPETPQEQLQEDQMLRSDVPEPRKMDRSDLPPESEDLDSNVHRS